MYNNIVTSVQVTETKPQCDVPILECFMDACSAANVGEWGYEIKQKCAVELVRLPTVLRKTGIQQGSVNCNIVMDMQQL